MREKYLKKRNELLAKAQKSIEAGNFEDYAKFKTEIEQLDTEYQKQAQAQADLNALTGTTVAESKKTIGSLNCASERITFEDCSTAEKSGLYEKAFAKFMQGKEISGEEKKAFEVYDATQKASSNTALIPKAWEEKIWSEIEEMHSIIADVPMTFVNADIAVRKGSITSGAEWYDEGTSTTEDTITTSEILLSGHELSKCINVSWKLKKMATEEFIPWLQTQIATVMSDAISTAFAVGKGVPTSSDSFKGQPLGIITAINAESSTPQVVSVAKAATIGYSDITSMMAKVKSGYAKTGKFYAKNSMIWSVLANIMDTVGRPIFVPDPTNEFAGRIFGKPVVEEDAIPDNNILFGSFSQGYAANTKEDISILTQDNTKARTTDYVAYAILDGKPRTTKAFALLTKATS